MEREFSIAFNTVIKMVDGFFAILPNLLIALCVYLVFSLISRLSSKATFNMARKARMDRTLAAALGKLIGISTVILGLLICAVIVVPSFSPDKLVAGLGITSVAIGFAFQNILQNFFAGMLLLWQKPFGIGDEIKTRDYEGTVEDITIRTTLLKTYSGQRVYIPNGILFTDPVTVNTAFSNRQVHIQMPVPEGIPSEDAIELSRASLDRLPSVAREPSPEIYLAPLDGSPKLDIFFWANSRNNEIVKTTDQAASAIHKAFKEHSANGNHRAAA